MLCSRCGSRDVLFTSTKNKIHDCECQHCGNKWEEEYDPFNRAEESQYYGEAIEGTDGRGKGGD